MQTAERKRWWTRSRRRVAIGLLVLGTAAYPGTYLIFAKHEAFMGQMCTIAYPGAMRMYAFERRGAATLGRTALEITPGSPQAQATDLFEDSIFIHGSWSANFWRLFSPLERLDHALRGPHAVALIYPTPTPTPTPSTTVNNAQTPTSSNAPVASAGPHLCVYRETYLRNGQLCRIVSDERTFAVPGSRLLASTSDVWLLRWDLASLAGSDDAVLRASSVTKLNVRDRLDWASHIEVGDGRFLVLEGQDTQGTKIGAPDRSITVLAVPSDGSPAHEVTRTDDFEPPRWGVHANIPFDPSGAFFIAENDGLRIFRSTDLEPVRELVMTPALDRFGAPRTDELGGKVDNSPCFLFDGPGLLVRIAKIYRRGPDRCEYAVAVVYDYVHDTVRDVELRVDNRTDVHGVDWADGRLWFYLVTATTKPDRTGADWTHVVIDERGEHTFRTAADESSDPLLWDREHGWLVRSRGYTGTPGPLPLSAEVRLYDYRSGNSRVFRIEFQDVTGRPGLFDRSAR